MYEEEQRSFDFCQENQHMMSLWFWKALRRIVQQKKTTHSIVLINDINALTCQFNQLWLHFWKYPFCFWLYQEYNTICSVILMLIILIPCSLSMSNKSRWGYSQASHLSPTLTSLEASALSGERQLQTSCQQHFSVTLYSSPLVQASSFIVSFPRHCFFNAKHHSPEIPVSEGSHFGLGGRDGQFYWRFGQPLCHYVVLVFVHFFQFLCALHPSAFHISPLWVSCRKTESNFLGFCNLFFKGGCISKAIRLIPVSNQCWIY